MCGRRLSRMMASMHTLNARTIAGEFVAERIDSASRARRFGRIRRRFVRGERRDAPSSPVPPGPLRPSGAAR
jgi:hypothetical protein